MKKIYMQPLTMVAMIANADMICSSGVTSGNGIGYGDVDKDGDKEPSSRRYDVWGDEEEEEDEY